MLFKKDTVLHAFRNYQIEQNKQLYFDIFKIEQPIKLII